MTSRRTVNRKFLSPKPTWTARVERYLAEADDFISMPELVTVLRLSDENAEAAYGAVSAALYHMRKHKVVDSVESNGRLYWFLNGEDTRSRKLEERVPEEDHRSTYRPEKHLPKKST